MGNIVIREILAADTFSEQVNKINYNFDQLLLAGGGPPGLIGNEGDLGPIGLSGTRMFTVIDIVNRTTGTPETPPFQSPNNYFPVATGSTDQIGPNNKPLRNGDLFIQEGDYIPGTDGDIWIYSSITNLWTQTGNNIKGNSGTTGSTGFTEWTRNSLASNHDYLTITPQTGFTKEGLVLGNASSIVEGSTVDELALLTIAMSSAPTSVEKIGISLGEQGQAATAYSKILVTGGQLQISAPEYGNLGITATAENNIKLTNVSSSKYYEFNSSYTLGSRLSQFSHYFHGLPLNVVMDDDEQLGTMSIYRTDKSALLIQPSGINSVVLSAKRYVSDTNVITNRGNANIALSVSNRNSVAIGYYTGTSADISFKTALHVNGNATIGTANETLDPGDNSLAVAGYLGAGVDFELDNTSAYKNEWDSMLFVKGSNSSTETSMNIAARNEGYAAIYLTDFEAQTSQFGKIKYNTSGSANELHIGVSTHENAIVVNTLGYVGLGTLPANIDNQLTVNGNVRLLQDSSNINDSFQIKLDLFTVDNDRPDRRGMILTEDPTGLVSFYIHSWQDELYNHQSDMNPQYQDVNSSRFNFRSHTPSDVFSLMSITGVNEALAKVQIGSEYNLSASRTVAIAAERANYDTTSLHLRKKTIATAPDSSANNGTMTGLLLQNDSYGDINGSDRTDLDFFFTDSSTKLSNLNYPQARIRTYTDGATGGLQAEMRGNMEFWTADDVSNVVGNNLLKRAMLIDSNQKSWFYGDIDIDGNTNISGNLDVDGYGLFSGNIQALQANLTNIYLGTDSNYSNNWIKGSTGTHLLIKSGDGYSYSTAGASGKILELVGGTSYDPSSYSGDIRITGGGFNSLDNSLPVSTTETETGGNVYISGGIPRQHSTLTKRGSVIIGRNPDNSLLSNLYVKGLSYFENNVKITSTNKLGIGVAPTTPLDMEVSETNVINIINNKSTSPWGVGINYNQANISTGNIALMRLQSEGNNKFMVTGEGRVFANNNTSMSGGGMLEISTTLNQPNYMYITKNGYSDKAKLGFLSTGTSFEIETTYNNSDIELTPAGRIRNNKSTFMFSPAANLTTFSSYVLRAYGDKPYDGPLVQFVNGASGNHSQDILELEFNSTSWAYPNNWFLQCRVSSTGLSPYGFLGGIRGTNSDNSIAFATSSDARIKENIVDTKYGLNELLKLNVIDYNFIGARTSAIDTGLLAQEVEKIFPSVVGESRGDIDDKEKFIPMTLDYGKFTPLIIQSIQDQQKLIEEKDKKIASLEERLAAIEKHLNI